MERILDVAAYICDKYTELTKGYIDEMRLHKLLYLSQREMLAFTNKPLFTEAFEGWKYGPVSPTVRGHFDNGTINFEVNDISSDAKTIVDNVIETYKSIPTLELSELTHKELSWKESRNGLRSGENGHRKIKLDDIRLDAMKLRPYDPVWGMYIDEFDDWEEETR